jgi:hypothetical protein
VSAANAKVSASVMISVPNVEKVAIVETNASVANVKVSASVVLDVNVVTQALLLLMPRVIIANVANVVQTASVVISASAANARTASVDRHIHRKMSI